MLSLLGWSLFFTPLIELLSWIPLAGKLLLLVASTHAAAVIFAFAIGNTMALLLIGLAWLYFRPAIGIWLLALVCLALYFTFVFGGIKDSSALV
jgi:hypothetical protein